MGVRQPILFVLGAVACSSGGTRDSSATGLSVGETTDATATGATAWVTETDPSASSSATTVATTTTTTTAGTDPDPTTGVLDDTSGDASTETSSLTCAEDEAACDAWFLPRGAMQWEAVAIGGPAALAPSGPVLAAFDIEAEGIAFVMTADELIRVDLETRSWVAKSEVADHFPEVNVAVLSAYSIPAYWAAMPGALEGVTLAGSEVAFLYEYDPATDTFAFDQSTVFGTEWDTPAAPDGAEVRATWLDVTNADGWVDGNVSAVCPGADGPVGPYLGIVTAAQLHILEAGYCFAFYPGEDLGGVAPTSFAGAPPADRIGDAAYNETFGLVVFATQ